MKCKYKKIKGKVILRQGVRPDVVLATQMYGHWKMPVAKDLGIPNPNEIEPSILETLSIAGSVNDKIRVKIYKV